MVSNYRHDFSNRLDYYPNSFLIELMNSLQKASNTENVSMSLSHHESVLNIAVQNLRVLLR